MSKAPNLAAALADAGGSTRRRPLPEPPPAPVPSSPEMMQGVRYRQPSRTETRPITVHYPEEVRDQLKLIALEQKKTLQTLIAEGFNDLFAKYGKPEIAPTTERGKT
jgi:hypothetical protein